VGRQLLIDCVGVRLDQLTESAAPGEFIFKGKFAQADTPTANKRIYPRALWEREISRLKNKIIEGKVFGELDHPDDGKTKLQRVAILIQDMSIDKSGQVLGAFKVLNTSMGKELKAIVEGGGSVGVSSRGYGSVRMNEDGNSVVQDDFTLLTFDPVADPAEETAYPELQNSSEPAADQDQEPALESDDESEDESDDAEEKTESVKVKTESIDRNKLNIAIKAAKNVYGNAIKESSHKEALSRAVEEGFKLIGKGYDMKDFAVEVAAEVMSIPKKPTMEQTGSNMDQAEILNLIKLNIKESMDSLLAEKDHALTEAKDKVLSETQVRLGVEKKLTEANETISKLHDVTRELAYGLYLQQHLGRHPKLKQIKESLGDLCLIESLEQLQNKVKVHISEVTKIIEAEESKTKKLLETIESERKAKKLAEDMVREVTEERDEAITMGMENASALYLERHIQSNPYQVEIRQRFKEMKEKSKDSVDRLLKEYRGRRINESSDFHRVRRSLAHRPKDVEHDSLVENHVKETMPAITEETLQVMGESFNMGEIKRLAGIKK